MTDMTGTPHDDRPDHTPAQAKLEPRAIGKWKAKVGDRVAVTEKFVLELGPKYIHGISYEQRQRLKSYVGTVTMIHEQEGIPQIDFDGGMMRWIPSEYLRLVETDIIQSPSQPIARGATPYDAAVEAIALYLPNGWVAQDRGGNFCWYKDLPECDLKYEFWVDGNQSQFFVLKIPRCDNWRTSLRHIVAGRVVGNGEG